MTNAIEKDFRVVLSMEQWKDLRELKFDGISKNYIAYIGICNVLNNQCLLDEMRKEAAIRKAEKAEEKRAYQAEYAQRRRKKKAMAAGKMDCLKNNDDLG